MCVTRHHHHHLQTVHSLHLLIQICQMTHPSRGLTSNHADVGPSHRHVAADCVTAQRHFQTIERRRNYSVDITSACHQTSE